VLAWGNIAGRSTNVPASLRNVVAIASGGAHCLALRSNGTVVAWGYGGLGQTNVPPNLSNVVAIAGGYGPSVALRSDGTIVTWGENSSGQTNTPRGLSNVVAIAAKDFRSHAIMLDPRIAALERSGPDLKIHFHTFSGQNYAVQYSPNLASESWIDLLDASIAGNGHPRQITDTNVFATMPQRFYRLRR